MTIKEQIRKEYEKQRDYHASIKTAYYMGRRDEDCDILSFLDSIPEQPVTDCHELKKHILEWTELMVGASFPEQDGDYISEQDYRSVIKQTARHFAEWGAEHAKK